MKQAARLVAIIVGCVACGHGNGDQTTDGGGSPDASHSAGVCPTGTTIGTISDKPTIAVSIGGHGPYTFVYDTGAPGTVVDTSVQAAIGSGPYAVAVAARTLSAPSFEFDNIATTYGISGVQGILGADVLGHYVVTVDRKRAQLWIDDTLDEDALAACTHVGPATTLDAVISNYIYVRGTEEDVDGWFLVDSGATLGGVNQTVYTGLQQRHPRPALTGFYTQAGIGTFWAEVASVGTMTAGGTTVSHLAVRSIPDDLLPAPPTTDGRPFIGLLPDGFLHHALLTVDYAGARIRLAPFVGDALVEPPFLYTTGLGLAAQDVTATPAVGTVLPGSAAAANGITAGATVTAINGTATSSIALAQRPWSLVALSPGGSISVAVHDGSGTRTVSLATADLLASP